MVEDEHCATAESVKVLDARLSGLLALLSDPDPLSSALAAQGGDSDSEDEEALREALAEAEFEAASLQRGNDALQAALESATALIATARAEAGAMRESLASAEDAAAAELQVRVPDASCDLHRDGARRAGCDHGSLTAALRLPQAAHRAAAAAIAEAASLRAEKEQLEKTLTQV